MPVWNSEANEIFLEALEHASAEQRRHYLDQACKNRTDLRVEVEALLAADNEVADFLANPPSAVALVSREAADPFAPISEGAGSRIGSYKLLEQIGEGGMGVVFVAEQTEPVRRRVALKIIKPGMDTRQVIARFEAERQALAMMDHPHIARVLDAGTTEAGRPYFVMELVRGLPITDYCDEAKLDPRKRLELFINVCQAVQHAHQKGIIHRDLKPSNVMVTLHDGRPVVKVIDFGVAKAISQQLTERTVYTALTQLVGTPLYMSPEQAEMSGLDVDTRSDVYSLGVLLYELLTGQTPFDKEAVSKAGIDEIRRIIREDEPLRPSRRLSTLGAAAISTVAQQRGLDQRRLSRVLRGELDWIVMRALEKDRERRYESASALAADIERYLHDQPVQACPPSAWYRLKKFTHRNKVGLAVAVAVAAAVLVAVGSLGWIANDRQTRLAVTARQVTQTLDEVESLYKSGKLTEAALAAKTALGRLEAGGGSEALRQRVQDWLADLEMVDRLEEARFPWHNQPGYAADFHKAFRDYGIDVLTLPVEESAARIGARRIRVDLATTLDFWALIDDSTFDRSLYPKLLDIARIADPDPVRNQLRTGSNRNGELEELAQTIDIEDQPLATLQLLCDLLAKGEPRIAFLRRLHRRLPDNFRVNVSLASEFHQMARDNDAVRFYTAAVVLRPHSRVAHMNLGISLINQGSNDEAIASLRTSIQLDPNYAMAHHSLGLVFQRTKRLDEAIAAFRDALRLQPDYADAHRNLGDVLDQKGLIDEAIASLRTAIQLDPNHAMAHHKLARVLQNTKRLDEAIAAFRDAIRLQPDNADAHLNLGIVLDQKGLIDEAISSYRETIRLEPKQPRAHYNLGQALHRKAKSDESLLDEVIACYREALRLKPDYHTAHRMLGQALTSKGAFEEGIAEFREAIRLRPEDALGHGDLGSALSARGELDEAMACYREAIRLKPDYSTAHVNLGITLEKKGLTDQAIDAYREGARHDPQNHTAHTNLGAALRKKGEFEKAIESLRTAIRLEPKYVRAYNVLGVALKDLGLLDDAIATHRESIRIQPDYVQGHNNLGSALFLKGLSEEAVAEFREAIRLGPKDALGHYNLGFALSDRGQLDEAMACYREAIRLKPDYADAHVNLGTVLDKKGLTDQAIAAYRQGARHDPQNPKAHYNLGRALLNKGESEKAIESFREAIRLKSNYPYAHYSLALALQAVGPVEEAIAAYREAIRLQPDYAEAHSNLGVCLARKGLDDEAIACYREALRLKPELHNAPFNLGNALVRKGALAEAESSFREAHEKKRKLLGAAHEQTLMALDERISVNLAQGKQALAEPLLRERLAIHEERTPEALQRYDTMSKLGACLAAQRKFDQAEPLLLSGYEGLKLQNAIPGLEIIEASQRLVQLYESWGQDDKANQWRQQLEAHKQQREANKDNS